MGALPGGCRPPPVGNPCSSPGGLPHPDPAKSAYGARGNRVFGGSGGAVALPERSRGFGGAGAPAGRASRP
eukprot:15122950-Alexandrium_andersonii.AAC.1